jgi:hypothetical protein
MTKFIFSAAAAAVMCVAIPSGSASAKAGDAAWGRCVWATAPEAAEAWLVMTPPKWMTPYNDPSVLLGHKLLATCDESVANPLKPNRMPNWGSLAAALRKAKPKAPSEARRPAQPVALCQTSAEQGGVRRVFLYEVVRRREGGETTAFQQYYANEGDLPLKLPQDLRIVPEAGTPTERSCRLIGDKGELTDA